MLHKLLLTSLILFNCERSYANSTCVCTSVSCPTHGYNYLTTSGGAVGKYYYTTHNGYQVVSSALITITSYCG